MSKINEIIILESLITENIKLHGIYPSVVAQQRCRKNSTIFRCGLAISCISFDYSSF